MDRNENCLDSMCYYTNMPIVAESCLCIVHDRFEKSMDHMIQDRLKKSMDRMIQRTFHDEILKLVKESTSHDEGKNDQNRI